MIYKQLKNIGAISVLIAIVLFACGNRQVENSSKKTVKQPPNIIVILTDDQGYADFSFHDPKEFPASVDVLTPNLEKLAQTGIYFRNGYVASATCGPSRSSILTGRSSSRFEMEDNINLPNGDTGPPLSEIFIPKIIKQKKYISGAFGKWHLGGSDLAMFPIERGFDYYWGEDYLNGNEVNRDYHGYYRELFMGKGIKNPPSWTSGEFAVPEYGKYLTDAVTDETLSFIKRNKNNPFFAYVAYHAPHSPFQTKESLIKRIVKHEPKYQAAYERMKLETDKWEKSGNDRNYDFKKFKGLNLDQEALRLVYLSMLLSVDDGVGKIVSLLEDENLLENTLIFYLSDNGAALARPNDLGGVNLPLREGKGTVYDGGVRVPFVMNWKGTLPAGEVSDLMVSSMDIFTTTVELAGATVPTDRVIDGVNLIPYLIGDKKGQTAHEYLFFRRYDRNIYSIRSGDEKLVRNINVIENENGKINKNKYPHLEGSLYDIENDITELNDISEKDPKRKSILQELYNKNVKILPPPKRTKKAVRSF
ncbi:sulfatase-like hydrolase/transferase [Maribacter thermophilus]|uniref:sulfatase-like hydrolase/transferase n=1 Tax=Maribacter thermophilus TaxID=1197874 RepID=UPI0006416939|nr:sulfatase-like hydrolase/transferase [Maribacter thermophilus]